MIKNDNDSIGNDKTSSNVINENKSTNIRKKFNNDIVEKKRKLTE
jgi:hypothetical protein